MLHIHKDFQLIILDLTLPEIDGLELIQKLEKNQIFQLLLVLHVMIYWIKLWDLAGGADDYLSKTI